MADFLAVCLEAAHRGGEVLLDWRDRFSHKEKGPKDLVTEADVASQAAIRQILLGAFPDHDFLAEEDAADRVARGDAAIPPRQSEFRWIVDPLDGTANYVHRLQTFAVSIALQRGPDVILGVVYDPISKECYSVVKGDGVKLNGAPIRTSGCRHVEQAMVAASFSANIERGSVEIARFVEVLHAAQSVRRLGSAALNLCYIAAGRLDAYWATSVCIWDVAVGLLAVEEAGGTVSALDGNSLNLDRPEFLASASPQLHTELLNVLARAEQQRPSA